MIQREREREEWLQRESELFRAEKTAQEKEDRQKLVDEKRYFLEGLKIPSFLQSIIDEEQLKGAYVLWERGIWNNLESGIIPNDGGGISLVWDIKLSHRVGTQERRTDRGSLIGFFNVYSDKPEHYSYRSLNVRGDKKSSLLSVEGRGVSHELFVVEPSTQLTTQLKPPISRSLSNQQLNPEHIQRTLASTYLDTLKITSYERRAMWIWAWPFEKIVSELNGLQGLTFTK